MSHRTTTKGTSAAGLREAFDKSFAEPAAVHGEEAVDLLLCRMGTDTLAIRVSELTAIVERCEVVSLPCDCPEFVGLAGIRGDLVPIFDLARLLGYGAVDESRRWFLLHGTRESVGLAIGDIERYVRVPVSRVCVSDASGTARDHAKEIVRMETTSCGVVSLSSVFKAIQTKAGARSPVEER